MAEERFSLGLTTKAIERILYQQTALQNQKNAAQYY
jgi:hypothetical protein